MKKYLLSILVAFCMVLCLTPMAAFADDVPMTINIDVGGGNTDASPDYKIEDDSIKLLKRDVTYVLTGTTDRKIYIWGRNSENEAGEATYIRANNVVVNGGIESYNQVKLVLEVPEGTDNTIAKVYAHDLKIYGAGTLHSNKLGVKQATSFLPSALHITDTKVIVNCPANYSGEWNGACVLDGNADVLYTACGDCAPLQIGVKLGDNTHSLTMKDSAKLRCLHAEPDTPSAYSVNGLEIFNGANLTMSGNSHLEVQGRPTSGNYAGYGLVSPANVSVTENASIKATGYDVALSVGGDLAISGGNVEAKSENSNGIYADGQLKISDGAKVNASGYYPALFGNGGVSIESGSQVEATSTGDAGIFSRGDVSIQNSTVKVSEAEKLLCRHCEWYDHCNRLLGRDEPREFRQRQHYRQRTLQRRFRHGHRQCDTAWQYNAGRGQDARHPGGRVPVGRCGQHLHEQWRGHGQGRLLHRWRHARLQQPFRRHGHLHGAGAL